MSTDFESDDWDESEFDDPGDSETVECPHCGAEIYEDAPQCPICGEYVVRGSGAFWKDKPIWYVVLALVGMVAVIIALTRFP